MEVLNENIKGDEYYMIKNIAFLFYYMGDFVCNEQEKLFDLWPKKEILIKKRIEVIRCL